MPLPFINTETSSASNRDLQRKIFLNTMRSVYPDSIQIKYIFNDDEKRFILRPMTVQDKLSVDDKQWTELMMKLNNIFLKHVSKRSKLMPMVWTLILVSTAIFVTAGFVAGLFSSVAYLASGPSVLLLLCLIVPNTCYTLLLVRPMLKEFEDWKRSVMVQFDKSSVEVIRITTGGLLSDRSPYRVLGALYYGSSIWFRYEDCAIEIFWRSVKSGKRVRRYSLMIQNTAAMDESPRTDAKLNTVDETSHDDLASNSTLDAR